LVEINNKTEGIYNGLPVFIALNTKTFTIYTDESQNEEEVQDIF